MILYLRSNRGVIFEGRKWSFRVCVDGHIAYDFRSKRRPTHKILKKQQSATLDIGNFDVRNIS